MEIVIDEEKNKHSYDFEKDFLAEGGQGAVYKTRDGDVVIKIDSSNDANFKKKIKNLIYKPLPPYIDIIMPLVALDKKILSDGKSKDINGYVMKMLDNFKPLNSITSAGANPSDFTKENIPFFLKEIFEKNDLLACKIAHYSSNGALRAKLYVLKQIAYILSYLHLHGMVYCDLSPNNVFINDEFGVKLIDADNIEYQSRMQSSVYTPNYEVPEICKGNKNSFYSDIYAFAVLSFYLLTTVYPFQEIESDWDSEDTTTKKKWEYPWIDDSNNTDGLRGILSTEPLKELFKQTFEEGKLEPYKRPFIPLWIKEIEKALNETLKSPTCQMSYYDSYCETCPYCDAKKPKRVIIESNKKKIFVREIHDIDSIKVPISIIKDYSLENINDIAFTITLEKDKIIIRKNNVTFKINDQDIRSGYERKISEFEKGIKLEINGQELSLKVLS